ncbi:MAG: CusA/CzcA family heavy metal efflux RND transporter [Bacteroidia bacterium]|nr:CusA/CzcA family heavy metal efflux RND transporter [Bacteroidia bacterium]
MLNYIISLSIKNKFLVGILTLVLIIYGVYEVTQLPIDAVPDITNNQVQVITVAPAYGAGDIERFVTFPIEQVCSNIPGIEEIRSFSRFGLSLLTIVFDDKVDIYWARQQVSERLQQVQSQIPQDIGKPELGPVTTGLGEIYQYIVRPKAGYENRYSATDLRTIQDWIIRRQLLGLKGVADISSFGGKLKQYEIAINPGKLQAFQLTIPDIITAVEKNNQNTGGAYIEKANTALFIRSEGLINSKEEIENILVKKTTESGAPVLIKHIASVKIGHAVRYGAMCYDDKGEVTGAVVMMLKGANSNEVIKIVKNKIEAIQKSLPEGVVIEPFLDRTKMVNNAIHTVTTNLLEGALIVVFVLVLFLGNLRASMLVASVIPLSMLIAIILMNFFGVSGNLMSLGALDFGLIVDGAVIIVEAVMHRLSHSKLFRKIHKISQTEMDSEVNTAASGMMNSAVFGQIIILVVYLPIFTLKGIEGKMFQPMAQAVAFALIGAFLLSLTYIPMMSAVFLSKKIQHDNFSDKWIKKLTKIYQRFLFKALRFPKTILISLSLLLVSALIILSFLGGEFIPVLEEGDFAIESRVLTGSNLKTTIEYTQKMAGILKGQFPEVEKIVTKIGSGEIPTDPMPMELGDMIVILKNKKEWTSAKTFPELAEKMSKALEAVPGIATGFMFPVQMRFNELMTGARQDVVCKIFGENLDTLTKYADKLGTIVKTVEGAQDIYIEPITGVPQIVIDYNRAIIAQYNLNIEDINKIIKTAFAGQITGTVFEEERRFDLVVRLDASFRSNVADIQNLLIPISATSQIPLYQLADVQVKSGPNQIQRENTQRRIVVGFNVRGRDVQSIVEELQQKVESQIRFPAGYHVTYGGSFENLQEAQKRLSIAVPVSLLLIFMILYFAFHSFKQGILIYTAIPLSAIGGIYSLALRGMPFSISAGIGFIALFGVAVLNGIVLIAEFNKLKKSGLQNIYRIVVVGTSLRIRPVLMTACVASLGFLPMALSNGAGAEVQRPLATVVIGGLVVATFLTLFVLPILYVLSERKTSVHIPPKAALLMLFGFFVFPAFSQQITLPEAIQMAISQNQVIQKQGLQTEYHKQLTKSAVNLPQTELSGEFGQVNSIFFDTRLNVSQSFNNPAYYHYYSQQLKSEYLAASLGYKITQAKVIQLVSEQFYHILILKEKKKVIQKCDSLFSIFTEKATLRFNTGETNLLEKIFAETQYAKVKIQLQQIDADLETSNLQFQLLLNSDKLLEPTDTSLMIPFANNELDSANLDSHLTLQFSEQTMNTSQKGYLVEKSKLFPNLTVGYFNQSLRGMGADDRLYNASTRFHGFQVGVAFPLFRTAVKAHIKAAKTQVLISENELFTQKKILNTEFRNAKKQYQTNLEIARYYKKTQLPNMSQILNTASQQYSAGEIDYLQWVILANQAFQIQYDYLEIIEKLNQSISEIHYLITK